MAVLTSNGKVVSSGTGRSGLMRSWDRMDTLFRLQLPIMRNRIKAARQGR